MNSKLIAIIAVVAMCGAALVGVGYAYQASLTTGDVTLTGSTSVTYMEIDKSAGTSIDLTAPNVQYDYVKGAEKPYTPIASSYNTPETKTIISITISQKGNSQLNTIYLAVKNVTVTMSGVSGISATVNYTAVAGSNVEVGSSTTKTINGESYTVFTLTVDPSKNPVVNIDATITWAAVPVSQAPTGGDVTGTFATSVIALSAMPA